MPLGVARLESTTTADKLAQLAKQLTAELKRNSVTKSMKFKHDNLTVQCILPKGSKPVLDEIDTVLAEHYAFTEEELDFIINYDIKYRMGLSGGFGEDNDE